jgi:hypothetical protein
MRTMPLQMLTWGTITAAVTSAVCLASANQAAVFCSVGYKATSRALGIEIPVDTEPAHAGPSAAPDANDAPNGKPQLQALAS